jgi:TonB family protein
MEKMKRRNCRIANLIFFILSLIFLLLLNHSSPAQTVGGTPACTGGDLRSSATRRVSPYYPEEAVKKGIKGNVEVEVSIDETGKVTKARVIKGHKLLRKTALEAARGWQFVPTSIGGKPVMVVGRISLSFQEQPVKSQPTIPQINFAIRTKTLPRMSRSVEPDAPREVCHTCPIPPGIDPNSKEVVRSGFSCCGGGKGSLADKAIKKVLPAYPEEAKNCEIKGHVIVEVMINEVGDVISTRALYGQEALRLPALDAAKEWKFQPTLLKGKPVKVIGAITINFNSEEKIENHKEN